MHCTKSVHIDATKKGADVLINLLGIKNIHQKHRRKPSKEPIGIVEEDDQLLTAHLNLTNEN